MSSAASCHIAQLGNVTRETLASWRRQFNLLDTDEDGKISAEQLSNVFRSIGLNVTDPEMSQAMDKIDSNGDGFITFDDFVNAKIKLRKEARNSREEDAIFRSTFQVFDRNQFGMISATDIWIVLKNLGKDFSLEDAEEIIQDIDESGSGRITYAEFLQAMSSDWSRVSHKEDDNWLI